MMNLILEDWKRIIVMFECGDIWVVMDSVWVLEDVKEVYEKLVGMYVKGKILVYINKELDYLILGWGWLF